MNISVHQNCYGSQINCHTLLLTVNHKNLQKKQFFFFNIVNILNCQSTHHFYYTYQLLILLPVYRQVRSLLASIKDQRTALSFIPNWSPNIGFTKICWCHQKCGNICLCSMTKRNSGATSFTVQWGHSIYKLRKYSIMLGPFTPSFNKRLENCIIIHS